MELLLQRRRSDGEVLPGEFFIDGVRHSYALERTSLAIPAGRYRVRFTVSDRATHGELWSPDPQHRLPLVDGVPGRTGIRIHAANDPLELLGCPALGFGFGNGLLRSSRAAVSPFIDHVRACDAKKEAMWIEVKNPIGVDAGRAAAVPTVRSQA